MAQATHAMEPRTANRRKKTWEWPWWAQPAATVTALSLFSLYAMWEVFFQTTGRYQNYLSPLFSPDLHAMLGIRLFPALYIVWAPLLFRATCYYYRKAYYRSFFGDPPACAMPERPRKREYTGETRLPFILNNLHRFFLYVAIIVLAFLWKDAIEAFFFPGGFGVGLGSVIMLANVILLTAYTFSCHALRHLVGGNLDCFSCGRNPVFRYGLWRTVTKWNENHAVYAWLSLFSVWFTAVYIRLLIVGVFHDVRFF